MIQKLISSLLTFLLGFNLFSSNVKPEVVDESVTIIFAGDVMLGRSVMGKTLEVGDNYYPFRKTSEFLNNADMTFVNLENPITSDCKPHVGGYTFCTTFEIAKGLNFAGIDIVSLANNHSSNFGKQGLDDTKEYLDLIEVSYTGVGELLIKEVNGIKFGFLGFDYVFKPLTQDQLDQINNSNSLVDVLIVSPHWGDEYTSQANKFQKETAMKFIENGADLIIGHHPHWVQNNEVKNEVPVYYSLGNFVFDQMWSEETKKGMLVKIKFGKDKIIDRKEYYTYISKIGQPEIIP